MSHTSHNIDPMTNANTQTLLLITHATNGGTMSEYYIFDIKGNLVSVTPHTSAIS